MTEFKFIPKEIDEKKLQTIFTEKQALLEIAYQLRRIADILNTELKNEN